jgi:transcriptional regulator with XRE-family HTH domain
VGTHWVEAFDPRRLVAAREERHLRQQDLAERLYTVEAERTGGEASDVFVAARRMRTLVTKIAFYETGRHQPRGQALQDLATALKVDPLDLLAEGTRPTLATLRARMGLSQRDIAVRLGMSRAGYGHVEQGRRALTAPEAQRLREILSVGEEQFRAALAASPQDADTTR